MVVRLLGCKFVWLFFVVLGSFLVVSPPTIHAHNALLLLNFPNQAHTSIVASVVVIEFSLCFCLLFASFALVVLDKPSHPPGCDLVMHAQTQAAKLDPIVVPASRCRSKHKDVASAGLSEAP